MTTTLVKRPARIKPPGVSTEEIGIAEPPKPEQAPPASANTAMMIMPVVSGAGSLLVAITNPERPLFAAAGLLFMIASIALGAVMIMGQRTGPRKQLREARERYLDYAEDLRRQLRKTIAQQKKDAGWRHPEPGKLLDIARTNARRWERRPVDDDFLVLRGGLGDQPIATTMTMLADTGPLNELDPVCLEAAKGLQSRYSTLHEQPVLIDLKGTGVLSVLGDRAAGRALARTLLAQLLAFHSPEEVRLAVVRAETHAGDWEFTKWLPHTLDPHALDGEIPVRLIAPSVPALAELLQPEIEARLDAHSRRRGQQATVQRHLVVFVDGENLTGVWGLESPDKSVTLAELGIHVVMLLGHRREEPEAVDNRITVSRGTPPPNLAKTTTRDSDVGWARHESSGFTFRIDPVPPGLLTGIARVYAPLRLALDESEDALSATVGLPEILGVKDVAQLDPAAGWKPRALREFLRVPVGISADGRPVMLDLKESAHGGMGPHGLIVGATGSGKSEMLRTMIASIVINHPPNRLAMMLIDFKGGATFAGMAPLPHLAGMVTNIEDDLTLVDRMRDALFGEMRRRQQVLKEAGNLPNVHTYQALLDAGRPLEPLPHLLVIIDEFSELLTAKPDFAELFVAVGRIGRSIGVHLLLASQRLEMGKIRGLESHLSYRISLRTFSDAESREAIGVPDAYHLPPEPGSGYLKVDTTVFERFKAALVSSPYTPPEDQVKTVVPVVPYLALNGIGAWMANLAAAANAGPSSSLDDDILGTASKITTLDVIVERLSSAGAEPVRPVWLDPLPSVLTLDTVQDPNQRGTAGTVQAALGLVDDPAKQAQFPLDWDFTGGGGNLQIIGAPQSGKSFMVRSMILSMALRYAPGEVAFYCIDYGGGSLSPLEGLPHVASVASRIDGERIRRTVGEVITALDQREELFRQYKLDSPEALREARAAGRVPPEVPADIFLVVDGWGSFREDFEDMEWTLADFAGRGLAYGVHMVVTVTQSMQIRMRMQPAFGGRLELRLNDSFDTAFDRKVMERIDRDTPGRGLMEGNLLFQATVPRVDGVATTDDIAAAQAAAIAVAVDRWPAAGAVPEVRVLPHMYPFSSLEPAEPGSRLIPVGINERDLGPTAINLEGSDPHLLVYGDGETGKTNLLRVLLRGYMAQRPASELGIVVVDYRRTLLDVVPKEYELAYCTAQQQTFNVAEEIAGGLLKRVPGPDVTSEQLRNRSWWKGLEVLFVIDDYDLVSTGSGNPLQPLLEYAAQARDLGFHLVISRRIGGLARAMHEPLLQRLGDLSTPGFMFSGDRMEGQLINGIAPMRLPVGRALYCGRGGSAIQVQTAYLEP